jgi:TolB-like protein/class 3 adenylate cyclase
MSSNSDLKFEIGHVLFIDIVGYSKLLINEQSEQIRKLKEIVRGTEQFRIAEAEGKLLRLPTGDGGALVFRTTPETPVLCALEIAKELKGHPELKVRMGIHSGPVNEIKDLNEQANIAGAGINIAQRVMDCGDAGHILLSKRVTDDLEHYPRWRSHFHDLGECEVKHGVRVHVFNLYNNELGNPEVPDKLRQAKGRTAGRGGEDLRVAVLPFKSSGDAEMESFANGLGEDITTGLSRFRYLSVVANASAAQLRGETSDEHALDAKLGARYVLEGSIRKGGAAIRVSAQLIDTQTGARLWAETYNRDLQALSIFEIQDDVAARIVATVADGYGVLVHSMREATQRKDEADFTSAEWQFQFFAYREQISPASHGALRGRLERAAKSAKLPSDFWACLAQVLVDEYSFGFGADETSLDRALAAARRGVEMDRANQFAMVALAQAHFFRQDLAAFGPAAERAMALNPLNTDALGILGLQIVHTGEFERGTAIVRRAMELNPNHAGWMHFAPLWDHFHKGEYEQALERANRVDVPGHFWPFLVMASACGHLGRKAEAEAAVRDLLALDPEFAAHVRYNVGTWHFASGLMEPILDGLRKAGLAIPENRPSDAPKRMETATAKVDRAQSGESTGVVRGDEGFWVAVLPFKYGGSNADLTALAEGIAEEIVTGLSRFSYLKVIARSSTARYANESVDVRSAGKELGARYVMEGSLRQAGTKLRLAVQLIDAKTGAHLWAENYERSFSPETIFELQDELVPRIVSTVADQHGALVHSMSESLRGRKAGEYSPHEAVLRAFGYWERMTPAEHAEVRDILEAAVAVAPDHSDCLAELAFTYWHEYAFGYNLRPDSLGRARAAAQRAVASAPTSHFAHCALATTLFFQKDYPAFRAAAERALALNRMDSSTAAILGNMIAYAGNWEHGVGILERAMQLNPHHAGWYNYVAFCDAYRRHDYRGALASALKVNMPTYHWPYVYLAAAYGQLGEEEHARSALRELHALWPNFGAIAREEMGKWLDAELTEHLLDGLRKAGLEIAGS